MFFIKDEEIGTSSTAEIYKDVYGSTDKNEECRFRPNFLVAMVVAPFLFDKSRASKALDLTAVNLVGPLGIKTLAPSDLYYNGNYHGNEDSKSRGANYHQGPEWLWLQAYFYIACLKILPKVYLLHLGVVVCNLFLSKKAI